MKTKRIASLLLVLVMVLGLCAGCGKKDNNKTQSDVIKGAKLTVGIPQKAAVTDYDDNALTKWLEETTGIDLEFSYFSSSASEYRQQFSLMCTSGEELPDVLLGFYNMGVDLVKTYGQAGYFKDLTQLIEKYGKNYTAGRSQFTEGQLQLIDAYMVDRVTGGIYGMPMTQNYYMSDQAYLTIPG